MTVLMAVFLGALGIIFGSFVNALVWRLHEQSQTRQRKAKPGLRPEDLSIVRGRSMCPDCHHMLMAKDLVPILSWLSLRGKCRYCHARIQDSPLVEITTGLLFVVSYLWWPFSLQEVGLFQFVLWLGFVVGFVALAAYDLRWMMLPDRITYPLGALAALQVIVAALWQADVAKLYMPALSAVVIFGLFWGLFQVSKGRWIGGGDVKLAVTLGLLVGTPLHAFLVIFLASLFGTLVSVPALMRGRKGLMLRIPFGPYLLLATFVVVLWGGAMIDWYTRLLG